MKEQRAPGPELLRLLAMAMIITLHYLDKGGILPPWSGAGLTTVPEGMALLLEAFCLPAVNVFVLISGYFGMEKALREGSSGGIGAVPADGSAGNAGQPAGSGGFFRAGLLRTGLIWGRVLFYSVVLSLLFFLLPRVRHSWTPYRGIERVFPVITNQYWFATAFILLMLVAPLLAKGLAALAKREYMLLLALLLGIFSLSKTVFFFIDLPLDDGGYGVLWFIVLYAVGGYLCRFGLPFMGNRVKSLLLYVLPCLGTFLLTLALRGTALLFGRFAAVTDHAYTYNHLFCFLSSVGLVSFFFTLQLKAAFPVRLIRLAAPAVFGVYLIHEHPDIRYLWPGWFHTRLFAGTIFWPVHWLGVLAALYLICLAVSLGVELLFRLFTRRLRN